VIFNTLQNQANSPLLRLPAEIRNKICSYVLRDGCIRVCTERWSKSGCRPCRSKVFSHAHFTIRLLRLLETCQQIYAEARLLVFSLNPLIGGYFGGIDGFLTDNSLDPSQEAAITTLVAWSIIAFDCRGEGCMHEKDLDYLGGILKRLTRLPGLGKIVVRFWGYDKADSVLGECGVRARQETEKAVNGDCRTITMEYKNALLRSDGLGEGASGRMHI
jgi:hypothetical protein